MTKDRLEAFSDGVFAISITLLVLNIRIPGVEVRTDGQLRQALKAAWPNLLTFVFSFLVVGVFWVAHQRICFYIRVVNHYILWANIFYLLTIALIPFPAATLATHPLFPSAIILYCGLLFLCAAQHFIFLFYIHRHPVFRAPEYTERAHRVAVRISGVGPVCYLCAAVFSFVNPLISFCFILAALLFYIVFIHYLAPGDKVHS